MGPPGEGLENVVFTRLVLHLLTVYPTNQAPLAASPINSIPDPFSSLATVT